MREVDGYLLKKVLALGVVAAILLPMAVWAQQQQDAPEPIFPEEKPYSREEQIKRVKELQEFANEFQALLRKRPKLSKESPEDYSRAVLKFEKALLLLQRYRPCASRDEMFKKELDEGKPILKALSEGKKPKLARTGMIERAYLCDIDDSAQPYYIYVPDTVDLEKPAPMVIFLHGYVGDVDKVNWLDQLLPGSMKELAEKMRAVMLVPFARSNTDFLGIGERDVLKTITLAKRDYKIDADRVYLCGASMGGSGVWAEGAHYPHLFAAIVPASGRSDYNMWQNVERGVLTPFKQFIIDRDYAITLKPNFRSLPAFAFHGELDWLVKPDQSRLMVKELLGMKFHALYLYY